MKRSRGLRLESLESRTPLAVDVSLEGTVLTVSFDDAADDVLELSITADGYSTTGATVVSAVGTVTQLVVKDAGTDESSSFTLREARQVLTGGLTIEPFVATAMIADSVNTSGGAVVVDAARLTFTGGEIDSGTGNQEYGGAVQLGRGAVFDGEGDVTFRGPVSVPDSAGKIGGAWAVRGGGASSESTTSVARFGDGSSIVTGSFIGTASFGAFTLTSLKDDWDYYTEDIFIAKIDAEGNVLWARRAGGDAEGDIGVAVTPLADGSAIVSGNYRGVADFGLFTLGSTSLPGGVFVARIDASGIFSWATAAGSTESAKVLESTLLNDGAILCTGTFSGTVTFGSTTLNTSGGLYDEIFVAKLDVNGGFQSATKIGIGASPSSSVYRDSLAMTAAADGSAIVTGLYRSSVWLGSTFLSGGVIQNFVAKINPAGSVVWAKNLSGRSKAAAGPDGSVIVAGGSGNAFITTFDAAGNMLWSTSAFGASLGSSVTSLADGSAIVTGRFEGNATFGESGLAVSGGGLVSAKVDRFGSFLWAKSVAAPFAAVRDLAVDADGSAIVAGVFNGPSVFGSTTLQTSGFEDVFVANLDDIPDLVIAATGTTTFDVGVANVTSLAVGGPARIRGNIVTTGNQTFGGPVTLTGNTSLSATQVEVTGPLAGGAHALAVTATGIARFNGPFSNLASVDVDGDSEIAGAIATQGNQIYRGTMLLVGDTSLSAADLTVEAAIDGAGNDLAVTAVGTTRLLGPVDGVANLSAVGQVVASGDIRTIGDQSFGGPLTLAASVALDGDAVHFAEGVVGAGHDLTLDFAGPVSLDSQLSGIDDLKVQGRAVVSGTVTTTGLQSFGGGVTLAGDAVLQAVGSVSVAGAIDGAYDLSIVAKNGVVELGGAVGAAKPLASLAIDTAVTTLLGGGVTTIGDQTYLGDVRLAATTSIDAGDGDLRFGGKVEGIERSGAAARPWVRQAGRGGDIATFADGSSVMTGEFWGTVTFGATSLTSQQAGMADGFVTGLDANGDFLWAKRFGARGVCIAAVSDGSNSSILAGQLRGTANFGSSRLSSRGDDDIAIAKLDSFGNCVWAVQIGGTDVDYVRDITTLPDGSIIVTGLFRGSADFGSFTLTSAGESDIFVAKLDRAGTVVWAKRAGGAEHDVGVAVSSLADGSTIVTGSFMKVATFGSTSVMSAGVTDAFIAKLDGAGNFAWVKGAGGSTFDDGARVATFADGSAVVAGCFMGIAFFDSTPLQSDGSEDVFVAKLDANGNYLWVRRAGGTNGDAIAGLAAFGDGSAILSGAFWGTAAFGATSLTSAGANSWQNTDVFVARIDAGGEFRWSVRAGGSGPDATKSLVNLADGGVLMTGFFSDDPTVNLAEVSGGHVIVKFTAAGELATIPPIPRTLPAVSISASGTIALEGDLVDLAGITVVMTKSLPENIANSTGIKVADIVTTSSGQPVNGYVLSGADAASFTIDGTSLSLKSTVRLDFETKQTYSVTVAASDVPPSGGTFVTTAFTLTVTDVNEAPTAVALANATTSLAENTSTASRIKLADIVVTDDALGTNSLSLSGADAAIFAIVGTSLFLEAGVVLDFETKRSYSVMVAASDGSLAGSTPVTQSFALAVTDVTQPPTIQLVVSPEPRRYRAEEKLVWQIVCSQPVIVTGVPTFPFKIGSRVVSAAYTSGTGTGRLTFEYTVSARDTASAVALGTAVAFPKKSAIVGEARLVPAIPGAGSPVPGVTIDAIAPRPAARIGVPAGRTYSVDEQLTFTVRFSETVFVVGLPQISLQIVAGSAGARTADYVGGDGTNELTFRYIVRLGDATPKNKGITVGRTILGGTITDAVGNNAVRTITVPSTVKIMINALPPAATALGETSPPGRDRKAVRMMPRAEFVRT